MRCCHEAGNARAIAGSMKLNVVVNSKFDTKLLQLRPQRPITDDIVAERRMFSFYLRDRSQRKFVPLDFDQARYGEEADRSAGRQGANLKGEFLQIDADRKLFELCGRAAQRCDAAARVVAVDCDRIRGL